MELSLHANATTTPKTRAYIQRSKKSVAEMAAELGVSETTIYRWRARTTVEDRSHRPKTLTTRPVAGGREGGLRATDLAAIATGRHRRGDAALHQCQAVP
jgi:hypothetical protein